MARPAAAGTLVVAGDRQAAECAAWKSKFAMAVENGRFSL